MVTVTNKTAVKTSSTTTKAKQVFVPSDTNIKYAQTIVKQLSELVVKREKWESTDYKKANEGLYALLSSCLEMFNSKFVTAGDSDRRTLRHELATLLKTDGIKVQTNTPTLTMFVRYVFGSDRKRAHGYAYVLKAAISYEVTAEDLAKFIVEQGGIEEIKRKMVASEEAIANKAKREKALEAVNANAEQAELSPLATVGIDLSNNTTPFAIVITKPNANGEGDVIAVLKNAEAKLITALYKHIAKQNIADEAAQKMLETEMASLTGKQAANDAELEVA
jgi:hypothetical protein